MLIKRGIKMEWTDKNIYKLFVVGMVFNLVVSHFYLKSGFIFNTSLVLLFICVYFWFDIERSERRLESQSEE